MYVNTMCLQICFISPTSGKSRMITSLSTPQAPRCSTTEARHLQHQAFAAGTSRNLHTQIRTYVLFCLYTGLKHLPVSDTVLIRYITFLSRSFKSWTSILNYINGVRFYHASNGFSFHVVKTHSISLTLKGIRKQLSCNPHQKLPITIDILTRIHSVMDFSKNFHVTLWAAFLLAFFGFLRKSNIAPPPPQPPICLTLPNIFPVLLYPPIQWNPTPDLTWSKTIQSHQRVLSIPFDSIPYQIHHFVQSPLSNSCYPKYLPLPTAFLLPSGSSLTLLTHSSFVIYLRLFLSQIGADPSQYSGHSFRRGGCSYAWAAGVPPELLKIHGDWRSDAFHRYISIPLCHRHRVAQQMVNNLS